jgi:predicted regulator of amino acid metabolism with ACT domain
MMFLNYTDPFAAGTSGPGSDFTNYANITEYGVRLKSASEAAFDLGRIEKYFKTINTKAVSLNTEIGLGIKSNVAELQKTLSEVYNEGIQYGISWDDASKLLSGIQGQMGRLIPTTAENTKNALIFGKAIGETPENVAKLVAGMTEYGITQSKSIEIMNKVAATARASGVDAKKLTATVSSNIQKAQIYGFKNGIEGLTKMAAQAQRVGFSLDYAQKTANKILDGGPEKAVEMASELQALGGNIGALGDPFQLIHMSMYDMEGLQDQLIKASSAAVDFNETTGEFKIGGEEMLRLRKQADILGLSYEEVAKGAINARKEQEIMSKGIDFRGLTEEQKGLVSSLAEIGPGGKVSIDLPGFNEGTRELGDLLKDPAFMAELKKYGENLELAEDPQALQTAMLQNAKDQLSVEEQQLNTLVKLANQGIEGVGSKGFDAIQELTKTTMYNASSGFNDLFTSIKTTSVDLGQNYKDAYANLTTLFKTGVIDPLITSVTSAINTLNNTLINLKNSGINITPTPAHDAFVPAGGGKMVTGSFGKFLGDTKDDMLLSPGIGDFFNKYNEAENNLKSIGGAKSGGDLSLLYKNATSQPSQNLVDLLTKSSSFSPTNTEITQKVEIGGKTEVTLNINSNIPQNLINEVLNTTQLKETIMTTVNTRLSAEYSDKLSNAFITQKRG